MKTVKIYLIIVFIMSSKMLFSQQIDSFLQDYHFYKLLHPEKANEYTGIQGNPYLNSEFAEGVFFLKDTSKVKLPVRYNIYSDEMEYQQKGINFVVGNPESLNRILLGESVFVYLPFIQKGGYFELFESGKCFLVQKRRVKFKPAEGPKPVEGFAIPAKFVKEPDIFYIVVNHSEAIKIANMKSVLDALKDQKPKIESFIKQEKIKNTRQDNLIKIVKYYNSL